VPLGVHGKNGSWAVVKRIIEGKPVIIHGDGTSLWTITHNSDFARAYSGLLGNIHAVGQAVQIMSRETVTWNQIYEAIADALGKPLHAVHVSSEFLAKAGPAYDFTGSLSGDKASSVVFDTSRLERLVPGFHAEVSAAQGIRSTIEYILLHKECQKDDPEFDAWCDKVIDVLDRAAKEIAG
jgi:nucleoside-diphosphate-sugar epimerase